MAVYHVTKSILVKKIIMFSNKALRPFYISSGERLSDWKGPWLPEGWGTPAGRAASISMPRVCKPRVPQAATSHGANHV